MTTVSGILVFLVAVLYVKLIFLRTLQFDSQVKNAFDHKRKLNEQDKIATEIQYREEILPGLRALKRIIEVLLQIAISLLFVVALGWLWGILLALVALLSVDAFTQLSFIQKLVGSYQSLSEKYAAKAVEKLRPVLRILGRASDKSDTFEYMPHSRDELLHMVAASEGLLSKDEKTLITHALQFRDVRVSEVMTPRSVVRSIDRKEVLGPLTLTDLHKTGHSRFPVTDGDLDHIVGILYAHDIMNTQRQGKTTVEKAMNPQVFYVNEGQTLDKALAAFLRTKHHLFIVVNEFEETTGVITIEDVIEKLIGHKIVDEFDQYDDLRAVARLVATRRRKSESSERV